jgi:DnaK suppressor protein
MNDADIEQRARQLLKLKMDLLEIKSAATGADSSVELDQARVGRLSRMDAIQAQQMALEAGRRRSHQLAAIEGALRRIESGEYGYCFRCGEDIGTRRLDADPAATRCMQCADQ